MKGNKKKQRTIIDELFPVYASSHLSFFGNSLIHSDPLTNSQTESVEPMPGLVYNPK
ncbi:MAG: hypothetical protein AB8B66_02685 [Rickettsiaceae bacterium]